MVLMHKDLFTTRLISLLAVQDGLVSASAIGVSVTRQKPSIKSQLRNDDLETSRLLSKSSQVKTINEKETA